MDIYFSELFSIGTDPLAAVEAISKSGTSHVELMLDGGYWNDFHLKIDEVAARLKNEAITYAVHTPVWEANLTSENSLIRQAVLESYQHTITFAQKLGAHHVVIHPGFCDTSCFDKKVAQARAKAAIDQLLDFDKGSTVKLLMENVGTNQSSIYTMEEYIQFCNQLPPEGGALVDIGHAHMNGWDLDELLMGVRDNLCALHLHDNDGTRDSHLPIGDGTVDWKALAQTIKNTGSHPSLILEYDIGTPMERLIEGKALLENLLL